MPVVYAIHKGLLLNDCPLLSYIKVFDHVPNFVSYTLYLLIPILFAWLSIPLTKHFSKYSIKKGSIDYIENANNTFLPSYLGYFFVALSINNNETMIYITTILLIFTYVSQALYFNPIFLILGYKFYNIKTTNGTAIFLISKHIYTNPRDIEIDYLFRINDHTFIELD